MKEKIKFVVWAIDCYCFDFSLFRKLCLLLLFCTSVFLGQLFLLALLYYSQIQFVHNFCCLENFVCFVFLHTFFSGPTVSFSFIILFLNTVCTKYKYEMFSAHYWRKYEYLIKWVLLNKFFFFRQRICWTRGSQFRGDLQFRRDGGPIVRRPQSRKLKDNFKKCRRLYLGTQILYRTITCHSYVWQISGLWDQK